MKVIVLRYCARLELHDKWGAFVTRSETKMEKKSAKQLILK